MPPADSDYRKRLAARRLLLSRDKQKAGREKAFSSPTNINNNAPKTMTETLLTGLGSKAAVGIGDFVRGSANKKLNSMLGPTGALTQKAQEFVFPKYNKSSEDMSWDERNSSIYNLLELPPILGDAATISRNVGGLQREGINPRSIGRFAFESGLGIVNPVGGAGVVKRGLGVVSDTAGDSVENLIKRLSKEASQAGSSGVFVPGSGGRGRREVRVPTGETPKTVTYLHPTQKGADGFYDDVTKPAQDMTSGLSAMDPSEVRASAFGGAGELVKGTPLERLDDLRVVQNAETITAVYRPPSAEEILTSMKRTDTAVPSRLKAKRSRLNEQIKMAQENGETERAGILQQELDRTPETWDKNKYSIEDARMLRDRWITASQEFEKQYGVPLPWSLSATTKDEMGRPIVRRIFGQDVEHAIPVNQGGTGRIEELTLLPTIPNTGKRDYSWDDYASANPEEWNNLIKTLYGSAKMF